jgi:transcriptional regulator with XRE-family HTH domain
MAQVDEAARRRGLGGYLRAHRERLAPGDVGLPRSPRRRTPGLRREEVAVVAGVGVAWYAWLEQGRVDTSRQVLEALAEALRMDADARRHLLHLAGFHDLRAPEGRGAADHDALVALIDAWPNTPALVLDACLDVHAWNAAFTARWPAPDALPATERNLLLMLLTVPAHELGGPDGESVAMDLYRHFRAHADRNPEAPRVRRVQERLRGARPDLVAWWECRSVAAFAARTATLTSRAEPDAKVRYSVALLALADGADTAILTLTPTS